MNDLLIQFLLAALQDPFSRRKIRSAIGSYLTWAAFQQLLLAHSSK